MDELSEKNVPADPLKLFQRWFAQARENKNILLPETMSLATVSKDGLPSARMVLLKTADGRGFVFYTNYKSRKARELAVNPNVALVFYWAPLDYQVRVEGTAQRVSAAESDAYFQTRPRESQIGALASPQSEVIGSREALEKKARELEEYYLERPVKRPEHWGGYLVKPRVIEFWKSRTGRLHDRLLYRRNPDGSWDLKRLAP